MKIFKKLIDFFVFCLNLLNQIFLKLFSISFLGYLKEQLENYCYVKKTILGKKINFFCPNKLIEWRVKTFENKEPETLDWINRFSCDKRIIFWDIGANIGLYSIYAALKSENVDVVAFEPSTSNLRVLSRNISINKLQNRIKIINQPLSDMKNNFSTFNESTFQEGGALNTFKEKYDFTGNISKFKNSYNLLGTNINDLLNRGVVHIPDYIKIDVDGIEHLILKGGLDYLSNQKLNSVLIEVNENFLTQFEQVKDIMHKCNFEFEKKDRNEDFYQNSEYEKMYNYIFIKKQQ